VRRAVTIRSGLLHEALRASTAIPLVFQPVEIHGRLLVDGGLANNLPVDVAKSMGVDVVIAVDASTKLEKRDRLTSLVEIMGQSISLQVRRECERQAALADLVIIPDTSDYAFTDFPAMYEIIRKGEEAAQAALPRIRELMRPKTLDGTERFRVIDLLIGGTHASRRRRSAHSWPRSSPRSAASYDDIFDAMGNVYKLGHLPTSPWTWTRRGRHARRAYGCGKPVVKNIEISGNTVIAAGTCTRSPGRRARC
jgi:hypothetical protein